MTPQHRYGAAVALVLLFGVGVTVATQGRQRLAASLQQRQQDGKPNDYAQTWRSWGEPGRTAYVLGFMEGQINGVIDSADHFDGKCDPAIVRQYQNAPLTFAGMTAGALVNAVTGLYEDPSNSLVPFSQTLSIARERLAGRPTDELLIAARRAAVGQ